MNQNRGQLLDGMAAQMALRLLQRSAERGPAMEEHLEQLSRLARDGQPLWIYGEAGSGRHTAALAAHALSQAAGGPLLVVHRSELDDVVSLWRARDRAAWDRLEQVLARASGGTMILDEGGVPDLALQGLVRDLLSATLPARLVLITQAQRAGDGGMLAGLLSRLGPRCVRVPPLRQRREEIGPLCADGAAIDSEALAILTDQPLRGNLRQLTEALRRLGLGKGDGEIGAAELCERIGVRPGAPPDPLALRATAQALGDVLRLVLPLPNEAEPDAEAPWTPLLLRRDDRDPILVYRLRLGPAPFDEAVVGAGLRPRPRGPGSGARTGDEPVLSRIGPAWRGQLLTLLRAAHGEMGDRELHLMDLALALLLAGPPLPPTKLARLVLGLPVAFAPGETEVLVERLAALLGDRPRWAMPACSDPAVGGLLFDVERGLVPHGAREAFHGHASTCPLCSEALWAFYRLPDGSATSDALPAPVNADGTPAPLPSEAPAPAVIAAAEAQRPRSGAREEVVASADDGAPSARSPLLAPPPTTIVGLHPIHWVVLSVLIAAALVAGTFFGIYLSRRAPANLWFSAGAASTGSAPR